MRTQTSMHGKIVGRLWLLWSLGIVVSMPGRALAESPASKAAAPIEGADAGSASKAARARELVDADVALARLYEAKKNYAKAFVLWRGLVSRFPNNATYLLRAAVVADDLKRYAVALPLARKLVSINEKSLRFRLLLVDALLGTKRLREARRHLTWLLPYKPDDVALRASLAAAFEKCGRPRDAVIHYDWLVRHAPKMLAYRFSRAGCYGDLGQHAKRLVDLDFLVKTRPRELRYRLERASCYADLGRPGEERAELEIALTLAPDNDAGLRRLVALWVDSGDFVAAKAKLRGVLARTKAPWAQVLLRRLEAREALARRRAAAERADAERWSEALSDLQDRSEDF